MSCLSFGERLLGASEEGGQAGAWEELERESWEPRLGSPLCRCSLLPAVSSSSPKVTGSGRRLSGNFPGTGKEWVVGQRVVFDQV